MSLCPIIELLIAYDYGVPIYSWTNPEKKKQMKRSDENQLLISGLLSAIMSFSESLTSEMASAESVKQVKMASITYHYAVSGNIIFFIGYDHLASERYESLIEQFLNEHVYLFNKSLKQKLEEIPVHELDFSEFEKSLNACINAEQWKLEKTQEEILRDIKELLLDILGPMSEEMYENNLREMKYHRTKTVDLNLFASELVAEISLLLDPGQANQIGEEIIGLIRV